MIPKTFFCAQLRSWSKQVEDLLPAKAFQRNFWALPRWNCVRIASIEVDIWEASDFCDQNLICPTRWAVLIRRRSDTAVLLASTPWKSGNSRCEPRALFSHALNGPKTAPRRPPWRLMSKRSWRPRGALKVWGFSQLPRGPSVSVWSRWCHGSHSAVPEVETFHGTTEHHMTPLLDVQGVKRQNQLTLDIACARRQRWKQLG